MTHAREAAAMSQPTKPTSTTETKSKPSQPADQALPDTDLEKVTGGKGKTSDFTFTHLYDKSSPSLG
jgi:type VI protein secretion system component Hcp